MKQTEKQQVVVQANKLVESRYYLTTLEQRFVLAMTSKINMNDDEFSLYEIPLTELSRLMNIELSNAHHEIDNITDKLMRRIISVEDENGWMKMGWVSSCGYNKNKKMVYFRFTPELKPYLLHLKREFTKCSLCIITQFKSVYTVRIYQLLKQYAEIGCRIFPVDDLKEIIGAKQDSYKGFKEFKRRVLMQAKKEMDSMDENGEYKSDLTFRIETIKEGRKITRLKFIIINLEKPKEPAKNNLGKAVENAVQTTAKPDPPKLLAKVPPPKYWKEFREYAVKNNDVCLIQLIDLDEWDVPALRYDYQEWLRKNYSIR